MTATLATETYNGWANYETWNVSLWIQNDFGYYSIARRCDDYQEFVDALEMCSFNDEATDDGVSWNHPDLDISELDELIAEL